MPRMRQMKMYLSIRHALHTIIRESINVVDKLRGLYHILTSFREKINVVEIQFVSPQHLTKSRRHHLHLIGDLCYTIYGKR